MELRVVGFRFGGQVMQQCVCCDGDRAGGLSRGRVVPLGDVVEDGTNPALFSLRLVKEEDRKYSRNRHQSSIIGHKRCFFVEGCRQCILRKRHKRCIS